MRAHMHNKDNAEQEKYDLHAHPCTCIVLQVFPHTCTTTHVSTSISGNWGSPIMSTGDKTCMHAPWDKVLSSMWHSYSRRHTQKSEICFFAHIAKLLTFVRLARIHHNARKSHNRHIHPEQTIFDQMWVPKMRPLSGHKSGTTAGAPTVGAPALVPKLRPFFGAPLLLEKLKPSALVLITTHNTQLE